MSPSPLDLIDTLIRRDPAARGLISTEPLYGPLCPGHLAQAAASLADSCKHAAIVTGFYVPHAQPPAAETDGPPGAVVLAIALESLGIPTTLVTDSNCAAAVRAALAAGGGNPASIAVCPCVSEGSEADSWIEAFFQQEAGRGVTHLIAIERVGPSHDEESLRTQRRPGPAPMADFRVAVPPGHRNRCHNSRGVPIDTWTAPLHRLFERQAGRPGGVTTIGIGDGGNEIGMGAVPWEELVRRLPRKEAAVIPCRIATDWNIVAGTSNWGGFALAAGTLLRAGRTDALARLDADFHRNLLKRMVADGPAVDGIIGRSEPTVDGLPFATYIQTWLEIRRLVGVD